MSLLASWRTALRVARREARRSRGRSALVVAMIGLPILALSFAAVSFDMFTLTGDERADQTMGAADARMSWQWRTAVEQDVNGEGSWPALQGDVTPGDIEQRTATATELLATLPAGSTVEPLRKGAVHLRTAEGIGGPNAIAVDATSPLTHGYVEVLDGRAPSTATEVALTKQAVKRLDQGLGGTVTTADGARSYIVVGLVEFPSLLEEVVLFSPSANVAGLDLQEWLVDTPAPVTWAHVRQLNESGVVVASRDVYKNPPPPEKVPNAYSQQILTTELAVGVLVAGMALLEIVLLAGPAFAVSARRRQRQLALVSANGGTPAHVRRIVLADGVVLGLAGAVTGITCGIVSAFAARPFIEELLTHSRAGAYRVFPAALAAISVLAVVTGVLAALVPAFITARQNVVASLAGRRGVTRSRRRWIFIGIAMVSLGTALVIIGTFSVSAEVMLAGLAVGELGLVLCTPALVGLIARVGRILPLAPRVALRDAARNRAAAAPAISAVMAAVAGSVAIGLYVASDRAVQERQYRPVLPTGHVQAYLERKLPGADGPVPAQPSDIEAVLRLTLPVVDVRTTSSVTCAGAYDPERWCDLRPKLAPGQACPYGWPQDGAPQQLTAQQQRAARADRRCDDFAYGGPPSDTVVDDGTALAALTGASADDIAAAAAVLRAGGVVVRDKRFLEDGRVTFAVIDVRGKPDLDPAAHAPQVSFPAYLLTGGVSRGAIVSPGAVAQAGFDAVPTMLLATTSRNIRSNAYVERGPRLVTDARLWILMAAAALITLGAAGIGTGLAAADRRADLSTLASVGASPRLRRGLSLSQSGVIAGLGSLLGATAGLGAAIAVLVALNQRYASVWPGPPPMPIEVPWASLVVALLVVPLVAMIGAGLLTRSRLPIERRL